MENTQKKIYMSGGVKGLVLSWTNASPLLGLDTIQNEVNQTSVVLYQS